MIFLLLGAFVPIWLLGSLAVDDVIEYQFTHYKSEWVNDGKSRGMFFNPKGSSYFIKWWNKGIPEWMADDDEALSLLKNAELWMRVTKYYLIALFPLMILIFVTRP